MTVQTSVDNDKSHRIDDAMQAATTKQHNAGRFDKREGSLVTALDQKTGDHSNETLNLENRLEDEEYARDHFFSGRNLRLDKDSLPWILNHTDCFDRQARLDESVKEGHYSYGYSDDNQDWDKVGHAIGNLQALEKLCIFTPKFHDEDDDEEKEDLPTLDWGIRAQILSQVRQKIEVSITGVQAWDTEKSILFARAIYGHPKITTFEDYRGIFPYELLDTLYSASREPDRAIAGTFFAVRPF
jgi:hypothetical protein